MFVQLMSGGLQILAQFMAELEAQTGDVSVEKQHVEQGATDAEQHVDQGTAVVCGAKHTAGKATRVSL